MKLQVFVGKPELRGLRRYAGCVMVSARLAGTEPGDVQLSMMQTFEPEAARAMSAELVAKADELEQLRAELAAGVVAE